MTPHLRRLRSICQDSCAEYGDPPCYDLPGDQAPTLFRNGFMRLFASSIGISFEQLAKNFSDANYPTANGEDFCRDCREAAGENVDDDPIPLDPGAVVTPLL